MLMCDHVGFTPCVGPGEASELTRPSSLGEKAIVFGSLSPILADW